MGLSEPTAVENPRSEEFDHTFFVKDLYRPTCISYQGTGQEHSRIVCSPDKHREGTDK